ncbi:hypothetical protein Hanom_Chr16g01452951 [Helianthus anomalus]
MNPCLTSDLFDDQYSMSLCEGFFFLGGGGGGWGGGGGGASMLQRMDKLRRANEELRADLRTSQIIAAELQCRVTDVDRKLLEEKAGRERIAWTEEREELATELKHQKELDSVS